MIRNGDSVHKSIITARSPVPVLLLYHVERRGPRQSLTADNASFLHGGELSLGNSKLIRIKAVGFGKNRRSRVCEKMVKDQVVGQRNCKTIGGEDIRKLGEEVGDTLWGGEESGSERRRRRRQKGKGEELLKTFWLATSRRRL